MSDEPTHAEAPDYREAVESEHVEGAPLYLYAKLFAIFAATEEIPKLGRGEDADGNSFEYVRSEDAIRAVRRLMVQHKVILKPDATAAAHSPKGNGRMLTGVSLTYTWLCIDTGQSLPCDWKGTGEDATDKGLYMGYTGSKKYFLLDFFSIPTYADPERKAGEPIGDARPPLQAVGDIDQPERQETAAV